jgi:hypothetical protein
MLDTNMLYEKFMGEHAASYIKFQRLQFKSEERKKQTEVDQENKKVIETLAK